MKFIHFNKIIHTNLKSSNVLINSYGTIKISDVGINCLFNDQNVPLNDEISSLYFMAPEILRDEKCNEKVDVYSFSVLVYFILSGGDLPNMSLAELMKGSIIQVPSNFMPNSKEIIEFCCNLNPQVRPSFLEIVKYLKNEQCVLLDLNKVELQEVQNKIKEYQKRIQVY